jgi:carbamoyl-phosphate synthase large subunit
VSDPQVIDLCFDKYKTAQWIESLGLKAPKTYVRLEDAKKARNPPYERKALLG